MKNLNSVIKADTHFSTEVCSVKDMIFSQNYAQMYDLDKKRVNAKKLSFRTVVPEKILENPLYKKEIKLVILKGNQPLTPAVSVEASTEGLQVERADASTAKMPNRDTSKQRVCSSTP